MCCLADTAEVYGFGKSEEFLAEFAADGLKQGLAAPIIGMHDSLCLLCSCMGYLRLHCS